MWLFKLKEVIDKLEPTKHKARLIAQGFTQMEDVDYNKIFSSMVKYTSIRLLSIIVYHNLHLEYKDVKIT